MMVNPGKFQAIIIDKKKKCHTKETLEIGNKTIKTSSFVKLLGVQIILTFISPTFVDL